MEDFRSARVDESANASSGLQAEWQESMSLARTNTKTEQLAFAVTKEKDGPGKDVADRLDRELKDFADSKIPDASKDMQAFQKMIDKFCSNPDKKKGMEELGDSYSRLRVQMGKDAMATYDDLQAEGARQPGRKELQADFDQKLGKFFDHVDKSPHQWEIFGALEWKQGEKKADHQARVREELKAFKDEPLVKLYDQMELASDKVDANKSAKEKELEALHKKQIDDYHAIEPVANKAYIRSTIEF